MYDTSIHGDCLINESHFGSSMLYSAATVFMTALLRREKWLLWRVEVYTKIFAHETSGEIFKIRCPRYILHQLYIIYPMQFQPTLYNGRDYLYILRFTLILVGKKIHRWIPVIELYIFHIDLTRLGRGPCVCPYVQSMPPHHVFMPSILCCRLIPHK